MRANTRHDKLHDALELLNEAALEKKEELYGIIGDKYEDLKELLTEGAGNGKETITHVQKQFAKTLHEEEEKLRRKVKGMDKQVRHNPWPFVGAAALGALVVGVFLGKK